MEKKITGFEFGKFTLPLIEVAYHPNVKVRNRPRILGLGSAGHYFYQTWNKNEVTTRQSIRVIPLSHQYRLLGIFELEASLYTPQLYKYILLPALRANACAICVGVNHPSCKIDATDEELTMLDQLIGAAKTLDIDVWDFDIITRDNYFSFRKNGLLSDDLIHNSQQSEMCLAQNIRTSVKVDYLKGKVKGIINQSCYNRESRNKSKSKALKVGADTQNAIQEQQFGSQLSIVSEPLVGYKTTSQRANVNRRLNRIIAEILRTPDLLIGHTHYLKIEEHSRSPKNTWFGNNPEIKTSCKIRLIGNWVSKTGLCCNERVQVIPLDRMLIIIPENFYGK